MIAVDDHLPTEVGTIWLVIHVGEAPPGKRAYQDGSDALCVMLATDGTDFQAERVVEKVDGTKVLKPVEAVRLQPFHREGALFEQLRVQSKAVHKTGVEMENQNPGNCAGACLGAGAAGCAGTPPTGRAGAASTLLLPTWTAPVLLPFVFMALASRNACF